MRLFRAMLVLGILLVTLLLTIDTTDGRKEGKKKITDTRSETERLKEGKIKKPESHKTDKPKKLREIKSFDFSKDEYNNENREYTKKGKNKVSKQGTNMKDVNSKIKKTNQNIKKYKLVEDVPATKLSSDKKTEKKNKSQHGNMEKNVDEVLKSIKKDSRRKIQKEKIIIDEVKNEELNVPDEEENIFVEEGDVEPNQVKKFYKLVELVSDNDEENQEGNETTAECSADENNFSETHRTKIEEGIGHFKTKQTSKVPKAKKSGVYEYIQVDDEEVEEPIEDTAHEFKDENSEPVRIFEMFSVYGSQVIRHEDSCFQSCQQQQTEGSNREGPKKLTFYLYEKEVDGVIEKHVVREEDGLSACELYDLLMRDGL